MTERRSQSMHEPDDTFQRDLHPDVGSEQSDERLTTAYDQKTLQQRLPGLSAEDLKQISILTAGTRLEQGATYLDLYASPPHEFKAMGGMTAGELNMYVPKSETDYQLWNRLIGVANPERTGEADEV